MSIGVDLEDLRDRVVGLRLQGRPLLGWGRDQAANQGGQRLEDAEGEAQGLKSLETLGEIPLSWRFG